MRLTKVFKLTREASGSICTFHADAFRRSTHIPPLNLSPRLSYTFRALGRVTRIASPEKQADSGVAHSFRKLAKTQEELRHNQYLTFVANISSVSGKESKI